MRIPTVLQQQAWNSLRKKPGFIATVVSTMGVALGALLCVFTLAYVLLIEPLPYPEPNSLFRVGIKLVNVEAPASFPYPGLIHLYKEQRIFSDAALVSFDEDVLLSHSERPTLQLGYATPEWFSLLDASLVVGRAFEDSEALDTNNPVAVISYETWQNDFAGDKNILDQRVDFSGVNYRVVGVLNKNFIEPEIFEVGRNTKVWLPWDFNQTPQDMRSNWAGLTRTMVLVGKKSSELSVAQAEQIADAQYNSRWQEAQAGNHMLKGRTVAVYIRSFRSMIIGNSTNTVLLLIAGVLGLVLITSTNIANLFLSRTAELQRQLAIRAAVGATRKDLFRLLFSETGLLMLISVFLALLLSALGFSFLNNYLFDVLPRTNELSISLVTIVLAAVCVFLFAYVFSKLSSRIINYRSLNTVLQSGGKGVGIYVSRRIRVALIFIQVSVAVVLIFININLFNRAVDNVFEPTHFEIDDRYDLALSYSGSVSAMMEKIDIIYGEIAERLQTLPQVELVSKSNSPLNTISVYGSYGGMMLVDRKNDRKYQFRWKAVDENYFEAIDQTLLEGRLFSSVDVRDSNRVMIVNDAFVTQELSGGSALGMNMHIMREADPYTIVGVVKSLNIPGDEYPSAIRVYFPTVHVFKLKMMVVLKNNQSLSRMQINTAIADVDPKFTVNSFVSFADSRNRLLFAKIVTAVTTAVLTILTIFLSAAGLYGVVNYSTQLRRFELGTRMAIGASSRDLIMLVIKDNSISVLSGAAFAVALMLLSYVFYANELLPYMSAELPLLFLLTLLIVAAIAFSACYLPLRRLISRPPVYSLRGD